MTPKAQLAFDAWYEAIHYPASPTQDLREAFWAGFYAGVTAAIDQSEGSCDCQAGDAGSTPAGGTITAEDIYAAYPRKVAKKDALRAICNAMKTAGREKLLSATKQYAAAMAKCPLEERKFIPHPATWFNRGSYDDDPAEWGTPEVSQFSVSH